MRDCMRGPMQVGHSVTSANSTAAAVCSGSANSKGDRPASISYARQPICACGACQPWCGVWCAHVAHPARWSKRCACPAVVYGALTCTQKPREEGGISALVGHPHRSRSDTSLGDDVENFQAISIGSVSTLL